MSTSQKITLGFGIFYVAIGILGFVPGVTTATDMPGHGLLLGIFAVNTIHNLVHLAAGGVLVLGGLSAANVTAVDKIMAVVFALLVPGSLVAPIAEGVNINLPDTLLHLFSALVIGYFGFIAGRGVTSSAAPMR